MRRILILLVIVAACAASLGALWIFRGREISSFVDRYWTVESQSAPIHSIAYEGNGTGGILIVNKLSLSLNDLPKSMSLSVGSTKDNQFALASSGKVFAFGLLTSTAENTGDMTGQSPSWKRHIYYEIRWKKASGADLQMLWHYEQFFYPGNGWGSGFMTHKGPTRLTRVKINE
ncbi:MAG: hypothetical protein DMF00_15730 [Verrucomicrobia bacterium]|nr:MAG: hypothetical protein DMF00_15730 [Verrucomicrobiota bacterium]